MFAVVMSRQVTIRDARYHTILHDDDDDDDDENENASYMTRKTNLSGLSTRNVLKKVKSTAAASEPMEEASAIWINPATVTTQSRTFQ
jgi:hypothetical protein